VRKLERRGAQAPALVEPSVRALDAALVAIDEARAALEDAIRQSEYDPRELEQTEERLFALRAAARKYDVPADELASLRDRFIADVAAIDAGEEQLAALERTLAGADRPTWRRPARSRNAAARPRPPSTRPCRRSCRR
jgi:DNA repair protein RecN (Recombination protein N)